MVPAAFRSPGLVFSSVPYVQVFPAGCSRLVVPGWLFPVGCSRLAVLVRLLLFPPGCRLFPPGFGCSRPASVALPRLQLSRPGSVAPARLRLFPSGCRSFLPPQFAEKKPNVCAVPYFFIYL